MDSKVLFNIQYGLFVLSSKNAVKDNACIINTFSQITANPERVTIGVNKLNYTHDLIAESKTFTISIISEAANFELFKHFGFQSGKNVDKFANFDKVQRTANGTLAITEGTNSFISANVINSIDCGTHTIFIADVVDMQKFNDIPSTISNISSRNPRPLPKLMTAKQFGVAQFAAMNTLETNCPQISFARSANTLQAILKNLFPLKNLKKNPLPVQKLKKICAKPLQANLKRATSTPTTRQLQRKTATNKSPRFSLKPLITKRNTLNCGLRRWANWALPKKIFCTRRKAKISSGQICMQEWRVKPTKKALPNWRNN